MCGLQESLSVAAGVCRSGVRSTAVRNVSKRGSYPWFLISHSIVVNASTCCNDNLHVQRSSTGPCVCSSGERGTGSLSNMCVGLSIRQQVLCKLIFTCNVLSSRKLPCWCDLYVSQRKVCYRNFHEHAHKACDLQAMQADFHAQCAVFNKTRLMVP